MVAAAPPTRSTLVGYGQEKVCGHRRDMKIFKTWLNNITHLLFARSAQRLSLTRNEKGRLTTLNSVESGSVTRAGVRSDWENVDTRSGFLPGIQPHRYRSQGHLIALERPRAPHSSFPVACQRIKLTSAYLGGFGSSATVQLCRPTPLCSRDMRSYSSQTTDARSLWRSLR